MKISLLFLLCVSNTLFCQQLCKGRLLDSLTKQPVEFANIGIPGKGLGTVTDENGAYSFSVPDSLAKEPVKISMIGYVSKTFPMHQFITLNTIVLRQNVTALAEVAVSAKKSKTKIIGNETKTKTVSGGFLNNSLGAELAVKLNIKHPQTHLKKFMVNVNSNTLNTLPVFRFNVYSMDENGYPKENILTQNIIVAPQTMTGFIELDLTPYNIFVDNDVFISLEWIKDLGDAKGLYFSTKLVGSATYTRKTSQGSWKKHTPAGIGMYAEVAY